MYKQGRLYYQLSSVFIIKLQNTYEHVRVKEDKKLSRIHISKNIIVSEAPKARAKKNSIFLFKLKAEIK